MSDPAAGFILFFLTAWLTTFFVWGVQLFFYKKGWIEVDAYNDRVELFRILIMLISAVLVFIGIFSILNNFFDISWDADFWEVT